MPMLPDVLQDDVKAKQGHCCILAAAVSSAEEHMQSIQKKKGKKLSGATPLISTAYILSVDT